MTQKLGNDTNLDDEEKRETLERMAEDVLQLYDTNNDDKLTFEEVAKGAEAVQKHNANKRYWRSLHKESQFTQEEYNKFKEARTMEIRKMIANNQIPENYNYSHVPLLQGNFINRTHVQRGDMIINIHDQEDEQTKADYKRYKMEKRYEYEEKLAKMTPEEKNVEKERVDKARQDLREMEKKFKEKPLSETQAKEVWMEEDHMGEKEFEMEKFFLLHDTNRNGLLDKAEVVAIMMRSLEGRVEEMRKTNNDTEKIEIYKNKKISLWTKYLYLNGDGNGDGMISWEELKKLEEMVDKGTEPVKMDTIERDEKSEEDEEYKKFKEEKRNAATEGQYDI